MSIAFICHPDCELHDTGAGHPESSARVKAVLDYLPTRNVWSSLTRYEAPMAARDKLCRVHDEEYVDVVIAAAHAQGRLVSVLEGGYNLSALSRSVDTHLQAML